MDTYQKPNTKDQKQGFSGLARYRNWFSITVADKSVKEIARFPMKPVNNNGEDKPE